MDTCPRCGTEMLRHGKDLVCASTTCCHKMPHHPRHEEITPVIGAGLRRAPLVVAALVVVAEPTPTATAAE